MSPVGVFWHVLLLSLMNYCVESCVQKYIHAQVPETLEPGFVISQVNLDGCGDGPFDLSSSDPAFIVQVDGTIKTALVTKVTGDGRSFWISVQDLGGHMWIIDVNLSHSAQVSSNAVLKRSKRRWSPPPFNVRENGKGPFPKEMDMIASDSSVNHSLYYKIEGPGVTTTPVGLFSVNSQNGMLKVHGPIDREKYPKIVFQARAFNIFTNQETDDPLPVTVIIDDENDNAPQFSSPLSFTVQEKCPTGTTVGKVLAKDDDEPDTPHTRIKYTLLNGTNLFRIDPYSGVITAATNTLDRETAEKYFIQIEIRDMGGAPNGLFSKGVAVVSLTDINDNPPVFSETQYKGQVMENKADVLVLRIPVSDKDLKNSPNWKAVYEITKGNEGQNFNIKTDPLTNDGLLYVSKPLNKEKQPTVNLEVMARNEVPLVESNLPLQKVPVEISVGDEDEGPEFVVPVLKLKVKENVANGTTIGTYTAIDPETDSSKGIRYYKLTDRGSWINVMENTGELKTAMTIDRESPYVYDNRYNITLKAVDRSQKTGTGTVVILIEDLNDNVPVIIKPDQVLCSKDGTMDSILIEAQDLDEKPYSDPFSFKLTGESAEQWKLTDATGTSVRLQPTTHLPNDVYKVPILMTDLQGVGKEQTVTVRVCKCVKNGECGPQRLSTALGVWGILAMLLGLLLLLLLCLLCVFACSTKGKKLAMADDDVPGGMLLKSNFEAPGEEVKEDLLMIPGSGADIVDNEGGMMRHQTMLSSAGNSFGQSQTIGGTLYNTMPGYMTTNTLPSGQYNTGMYSNTFKKYSTLSTMNEWRENAIQLEKKLVHFREASDGRFAEDILRPYGYEGVGSPAGSVGCCSIIGEQQSLDFLDSLGPKFKTLADVCTSK